MNMIVGLVWMLWSSDAVEHEHYFGLGMHALVIGCSQTRTLFWFGHRCFGHQTQLKTSVMMVWAWLVWSSDAVKEKRSYGLGMDALVIRCSRKRIFPWFGHGCPVHRMQSSMSVIWFWCSGIHEGRSHYAAGDDHNMTMTMTTIATIGLSGVFGKGRWPVSGGSGRWQCPVAVAFIVLE